MSRLHKYAGVILNHCERLDAARIGVTQLSVRIALGDKGSRADMIELACKFTALENEIVGLALVLGIDL